MDTVELVMTIEAEFQIQIPDDIAVTLTSMGKMRDYVIQALNNRAQTVAIDDVWERIKVIMRRDYAVAERHLRPETEFVADLGLD